VSNRRPNQNLPTLRSSTLISKTIVALSKVDIDSRNIYRDKPTRPHPSLLSGAQEKEKEHMRSQSGFNPRKAKEQSSELKNPGKGQL
jgi:hypothetical protein